MHRIRARLTYANVVSTLCLVLLVGGGTAFAASELLPKDSVGTAQIQKGAVTPSKLSKGSRTALAGASGPQGQTGATGPQGPKGDPGLPGAPGAPATGLWAVVEANGTLLHGTAISASRESVGSGNYEVVFGRNVSSCAMVATPQEETDLMRAQPSFKNPDAVFLETNEFNGTSIDRTFNLAVFC
jgi:hypothetical protein